MSTQFGKYLLQRKLAQGGMAEVFLAKQTGLEGFEKLVVVKRILPQLSLDESFVRMFLNEARVAARLNHPNVVQIFDLGKVGEQYFIAMEYVHGEDLRSLIRAASARGHKVAVPLICRIAADTLAGLHYAHTRQGVDGQPLGLVHRDVSPQNVIVTYDGTVKLVDFGIAKSTRQVGVAQTQVGLLKGKYAYMSPEQARGVPIDARSDVFSVGILLWEMCTWTRLFKRQSETATLVAVVSDAIPTARSVEPSIPPELDRILQRALARDVDQRYATAYDLRADLEALIRARSWEADALALERFMRELFADKLKAQADDVRAAGLSSVEDFLLHVEGRTSISWMGKPDAPESTPADELPAPEDGLDSVADELSIADVSVIDGGATLDAGDTWRGDGMRWHGSGHNHNDFDGGPTVQLGDASPFAPPLRHDPRMAGRLPPPSVPAPPLPPATAANGQANGQTIATTPRVLPGQPTQISMPRVIDDGGPTLPPQHLGGMVSAVDLGQTSKRQALRDGSSWRRVLIASAAGLTVAALVLAALLWPREESGPRATLDAPAETAHPVPREQPTPRPAALTNVAGSPVLTRPAPPTVAVPEATRREHLLPPDAFLLRYRDDGGHARLGLYYDDGRVVRCRDGACALACRLPAAAVDQVRAAARQSGASAHPARPAGATDGLVLRDGSVELRALATPGRPARGLERLDAALGNVGAAVTGGCPTLDAAP